MKRLCGYAKAASAGLALLLSPAVVVFGVPFAYGLASDISATPWFAPMALLLAAAIALNASRRGAAQQAAAAQAAAKSIT